MLPSPGSAQCSRGDYCKNLKMAGFTSWALISRVKDGGNPGVTDQNDVINPPDQYIRPALMVGFQIQSVQKFRYKLIQTFR